MKGMNKCFNKLKKHGGMVKMVKEMQKKRSDPIDLGSFQNFTNFVLNWKFSSDIGKVSVGIDDANKMRIEITNDMYNVQMAFVDKFTTEFKGTATDDGERSMHGLLSAKQTVKYIDAFCGMYIKRLYMESIKLEREVARGDYDDENETYKESEYGEEGKEKWTQ